MQSTEFGYTIEIHLNGAPRGEFTIRRTHAMGTSDLISLVTGGKIIVKNGDVISLFFKANKNPDDKTGKYTVDAALSLGKAPIW
jgi:hypothetical protein